LQVSPLLRQNFPLSDALKLSEALGYQTDAVAVLLPSAASGLNKALIAQKE
jgi:hypothetical protein